MDTGAQTGAYRIDACIGRGGMAEVFRAWHTGLQRYEALKVLPPQLTFDRTFVERFLAEARTSAQLQHPNIVSIYAVSDISGPEYYFSMELVEGWSLADLLESRGRFHSEEALPILSQMAEALDYAHSRGVVHRDIKPANILLKENDRGGWVVKVVDFGIAKAAEDSSGTRLTKTGMIVGTPEYMSPEQGGSGGPVDFRTDIYSMGVIAYEMLCGSPPFRMADGASPISVIMSHIRDTAPSPVSLNSSLSSSVSNAVLKALAKDPADRFHCCRDFITALSVPEVEKRRSSSVFVRPSFWIVVSSIALGTVLLMAGLSHSNGKGAQARTSSGVTTIPTGSLLRKRIVKICQTSGMTAGPYCEATNTRELGFADPAPHECNVHGPHAAAPLPILKVNTIPDTARVGVPFEIKCAAENRGKAAQRGSITLSCHGSASVSGPSNVFHTKEILQVNADTTGTSKTFPRNAGAEEYFDDTWGFGGTRQLAAKVTPDAPGELKIYVRATVDTQRRNLPAKERFKNDPPWAGNRETDQQGFPARAFIVKVQ